MQGRIAAQGSQMQGHARRPGGKLVVDWLAPGARRVVAARCSVGLAPAELRFLVLSLSPEQETPPQQTMLL